MSHEKVNLSLTSEKYCNQKNVNYAGVLLSSGADQY